MAGVDAAALKRMFERLEEAMPTPPDWSEGVIIPLDDIDIDIGRATYLTGLDDGERWLALTVDERAAELKDEEARREGWKLNEAFYGGRFHGWRVSWTRCRLAYINAAIVTVGFALVAEGLLILFAR